MESILYAQGTTRNVASKAWLSEISSGGYQAVIFDCDGTLVNSSEAHFRSFQFAVQSQGFQMDRDWYLARTGLDRTALFRSFATDIAPSLNVTAAAQDSISAFVLNVEKVSPIQATAQLVKNLAPTTPMIVGTNAETLVARASLQATGLIRFFDRIVSVSDGLPPKPRPDIFLKAIQYLGFSATKTLVFEDSDEGVSAARAAKLDVIKLDPGSA